MAGKRNNPVAYAPEAHGETSIAFVTKPKCGSQWIRNVLTDRRIAPGLGIRRVVDMSKIEGEGFPEVEPGTFYGPCFGTTRRQWQRFRRPADRCIFVFRDPRDMAVSWLHSILFSHTPDEYVEPVREELLAMSAEARVRRGADWVLEMQPSVSTFFEESDPGILCTSYERLAGGEEGFLEVLRFLGWDGDESTAREVIQEFSFEAQSGRQKGKQDLFSHLRKGTPGDWRNYFSKAEGKRFEESALGFLQRGGYEANQDWWKSLPETAAQTIELPQIDYRDYAALRRENEELRRELDRQRTANKSGARGASAQGWLQRWRNGGA